MSDTKRLVAATKSLVVEDLSALFARFTVSAQVFFTGALCRNVDFDTSGVGYVHLLRRGELSLVDAHGERQTIAEPAIVFFPGPSRHRLIASPATSPELVCAFVEFGAAAGNPLVRALPETLVVPLSRAPGLAAAVEILFGEAHAQHVARQVALDRLVEYFVILLLRWALESKVLSSGLLAAFSDPRLSKALTAIHDHPDKQWTLARLAAKAAMSRARFAAHFRDTLGITPLDYLTQWRLSVAQSMLKRGQPLKLVAPAVGYGSVTTFSRVFAKRCGALPSEWLAANVAPKVMK